MDAESPRIAIEEGYTEQPQPDQLSGLRSSSNDLCALCSKATLQFRAGVSTCAGVTRDSAERVGKLSFS
eukprot:COSAG05_NODE_146_length_16405_cov_993.952104_5_plen_69_part_00